MVQWLGFCAFTAMGSGSWNKDPENCVENHSSVLAWRITQIKEPGGLQFIRSQRVGYAWATNTHTHTHTHTHTCSIKRLVCKYSYRLITYTDNNMDRSHKDYAEPKIAKCKSMPIFSMNIYLFIVFFWLYLTL